MSAIIKVENLGKKFIIDHEERERYTALRDVLAKNAKKVFSFPKWLRGDGVKVTHEEFWALKDVNFEIQQGDRVGIIGRNGAGKSTLLKILSRITEPSTGRIEINGRVASLLEVGTGFHPELTGRENIFLNGAILGMSRFEIRKKFDEIVDFAEVERFLDTPVKRYSSGMYVRLAFAVAAHLEPEILVVDEVLAVGDAQFQKKCLGKMEDVSTRDGRTILFVSHNMGVIKKLCSNSFLLNKGQILYSGETKSVIGRYFDNYEREDNGTWDYKIKSNKVRLEKASLFVSDRKVNSFYSGEKIIIQLDFKCLDISLLGKKMSVSILLFDEMGEKITNFWSDYFKLTYEVKKEISVKCEIEKWPFRAGRFRLDLYTHFQHEPVEWIENVKIFDTENGDYFGNGILTNPDQGMFFINHKFI